MLQRSGLQGLVELNCDHQLSCVDDAYIHAWPSLSNVRVQAISTASVKVKFNADDSDAAALTLMAWTSGDTVICVCINPRHNMNLRPFLCQHPVPSKRKVITALVLLPSALVIIGNAYGTLCIFNCHDTLYYQNDGQEADRSSQSFPHLVFTNNTAHKHLTPVQVLRSVPGFTQRIVSGGADGWIKVWAVEHKYTQRRTVQLTLVASYDLSAISTLTSSLIRGLALIPFQASASTARVRVVVVTASSEVSTIVLSLGKKTHNTDCEIDVAKQATNYPSQALTNTSGKNKQFKDALVEQRKIVTVMTGGHLNEKILGLKLRPQSIEGSSRTVDAVTCSNDCRICLWDLASGTIKSATTLRDSVTAVVFDSSGEWIACALGGKAALGTKPQTSRLLRFKKKGMFVDTEWMIMIIVQIKHYTVQLWWLHMCT